MKAGRAKAFFLKNEGRILSVRKTVPFIFTLGNAFFGFCSIVLALEGEKIAAAYCIFLSAMMDALDGRMARLMKVESELGVELDSLCDAVSFCLAPAFLVCVWQLRPLGFLGIVIGAFFLLAGLFRLARFNVLHAEQTHFFIGLPTTIAGCFVVAVLLNMNALSELLFVADKTSMIHVTVLTLFSGVLMLMLAGLMVSRVRFPTFKQGALRLRKHTRKVIAIILFVVMVVMRLQMTLLISFIGYFVITIVYRFYNLGDEDLD